MNTNTGHLVRDLEQIEEAERGLYTAVPGRLTRAARRALGKSDETYIDIRRSRGKLAVWAREVERRKKRRRSEKQGRKAARKGKR